MVLVILINRIAVFQVESAIQLLTIRFSSMCEILEFQLSSCVFNCSVRLWLCREIVSYCFIPYYDCCSLQILTCYFSLGDIPLGPWNPYSLQHIKRSSLDLWSDLVWLTFVTLYLTINTIKIPSHP